MNRQYSMWWLFLLLGSGLMVSFAGVAASDEPKKEAKPQISPLLDQVTLAAEERVIKPSSILKTNLGGYAAGGLRIRLNKNKVQAFAPGEEQPRWEATAPEKIHLSWLTANSKVVYLAGYTVNEKNEEAQAESPLRVRRLDLASGKSLEDLVIANKADRKKNHSLQNVLASDGRVVVLSASTDDDRGFEGVGQLVPYRVTCFKDGEARPLWSKTFPSAGKTARDDAALLWAARAPEKVQPDIRTLSRLGGDILVCAGPTQDLICLKGDTGEQLWRVERIWEFKRNFIGPSVWQHIFGRSSSVPDDKNKKKDKKEKMELLSEANAIVGGPMVVPNSKAGKGESSIFVAVSKGPARYAAYLSDCVVYELDSQGNPLAMANLPRMVRGGWYRLQKDGLVWACQGNSFVKLGLSPRRSRGFGLGRGGSDLLCRVDWHRQLSVEQPEAWLVSDPAGQPLAFTDTHAFRVIAGGYVLEPSATAYNFPIAVIDLKKGVDSNWMLKVPFKGRLPEPETNYSREQSPTGKDRWSTHGPHVLAITWLQVEDSRLRVTLGMEKWSRSLEFQLADVLGRKRQ